MQTKNQAKNPLKPHFKTLELLQDIDSQYLFDYIRHLENELEIKDVHIPTNFDEFLIRVSEGDEELTEILLKNQPLR